MDFETKADVINEVRNIVVEHLSIKKPASEVDLDADFIQDLGADSLDVVELVITLESEFDIDISDEYTRKIRTIRAAGSTIADILGVKD